MNLFLRKYKYFVGIISKLYYSNARAKLDKLDIIIDLMKIEEQLEKNKLYYFFLKNNVNNKNSHIYYNGNNNCENDYPIINNISLFIKVVIN